MRRPGGQKIRGPGSVASRFGLWTLEPRGEGAACRSTGRPTNARPGRRTPQRSAIRLTYTPPTYLRTAACTIRQTGPRGKGGGVAPVGAGVGLLYLRVRHGVCVAVWCAGVRVGTRACVCGRERVRARVQVRATGSESHKLWMVFRLSARWDGVLTGQAEVWEHTQTLSVGEEIMMGLTSEGRRTGEEGQAGRRGRGKDHKKQQCFNTWNQTRTCSSGDGEVQYG